MKTIENYDVRIFTDNIEESAIEQIKALLSVPVFSQCKIRIMPDVHAGAGCVIGFTGNLGKQVAQIYQKLAMKCQCKGNEDWNFSAPHGAGRIMSRAQAFRSISLEDYQQSMQGIYSECLVEETKDESPMVYKPKDEIIGNIHDTVNIVNVIKPVYNFKAAES